MKACIKSALMIGAFAAAFSVGPQPLGAQNAAELYFPGDTEYESALRGAISAGRVPDTNAFPLFGQETEGSGTIPPRSGLSASFSTPTLYYDSPATQDDLACHEGEIICRGRSHYTEHRRWTSS